MITIKDVAELAGVSKATVSRALNNSGYVSPETKKKIDEIIEKYHYLPSASAVNLSKQETTTIGVVVPEIGNLFYADIVQGITRKADELNLSLVLFDTGNNMEREEKAIRVLQQQRVKGIILGPSIDYAESKRGKKLLKQLTDMHLPIVIFDRDFEQMPWDAVIYENYQSISCIKISLITSYIYIYNKAISICLDKLFLLLGGLYGHYSFSYLFPDDHCLDSFSSKE